MDDILFKAKGSVALVALNRPDDDNRITLTALQRLGAIVDDLAGNGDIPAVIYRKQAQVFLRGHAASQGTRYAHTGTDPQHDAAGNSVHDRIEALSQVSIERSTGLPALARPNSRSPATSVEDSTQAAKL